MASLLQAVTAGEARSRFGWGKFRPSFLQWLNNPKWLLVFLCFYYLTMNIMLNGTYSVSISTIEKRFGLSSSTAGLITSMFDIACLLVTAFVSYYGGQQSKARWLGSGLLFLAVGNFIFILPHFIIGPYQPGKVQSSFPSLCQVNSTNSSHDACDSTTSAGHWYYPALFCVGMLVIGIGGSPMYVLGIAYLDESVKKKVSSMYVGIFASSGILGAAIGFALGSFLLSINVDVGLETSLSQSDPRWIGNWWLGSVILIVTSVLLCPGMYGFPRVLPGATGDDDGSKQDKEDNDDVLDTVKARKIEFTSLKDLIAATKTLFSLPAYVFISIGVSMEYFVVAASTAFLPKILQILFDISPAKVSMMFGMAVVIPVFFGQLLGAYMVKRFKLGAVGAIKVSCIVSLMAIVVSSSYIFTNCDNPEILGVTKDFGNSTSQTINGCNVTCDCNNWPYYPVCDRNTTLWSPCHARCTSYSQTKKEFYSCLCTESKDSIVEPGKCAKDCGSKPQLFLLITSIVGFLSFFTETPVIIAILRSVPYRLRAYAMGWQLNLTRLLGSIPGPIIYGKLIDTVCIQWESTCEGQGSCQEYNHWRLVVITACLMAVIKIIAFVSFLLAWKFLKNDFKKHGSTTNAAREVVYDCNKTNSDPIVDGQNDSSF